MSNIQTFGNVSIVTSKELNLMVAFLEGSHPKSQLHLLKRLPSCQPGRGGYYAAGAQEAYAMLETIYAKQLTKKGIDSLQELYERTHAWAIKNELL